MNVRSEIKNTLAIEAAAITALKSRINADYEKAVEYMLACKGKVIIAGIGKSGLIGQKISATLSSTGTPSMFLHPVEAVHGDIGVISKNDVLVVISQSGETEEVLDLLPALKRLKVPIIAITGKKDSALSKNADCVLDSSVRQEACPMNLAPTASTTVQLAIGDGLAVALVKLRGFKKEDFAMLHPGGALGKKLLLKVRDVMHTGETVPSVSEAVSLKEALLEMTKKRLGCTAVVNKAGKMLGIFTDGDLRRMHEKYENPFSLKMKDIMTTNPITIGADELLIKALNIMEEKSITVLMVPDKSGKPEGVVHLHDILKSGVV